MRLSIGRRGNSKASKIDRYTALVPVVRNLTRTPSYTTKAYMQSTDF